MSNTFNDWKSAVKGLRKCEKIGLLGNRDEDWGKHTRAVEKAFEKNSMVKALEIRHFDMKKPNLAEMFENIFKSCRSTVSRLYLAQSGVFAADEEPSFLRGVASLTNLETVELFGEANAFGETLELSQRLVQVISQIGVPTIEVSHFVCHKKHCVFFVRNRSLVEISFPNTNWTGGELFLLKGLISCPNLKHLGNSFRGETVAKAFGTVGDDFSWKLRSLSVSLSEDDLYQMMALKREFPIGQLYLSGINDSLTTAFKTWLSICERFRHYPRRQGFDIPGPSEVGTLLSIANVR